MTKNTNTTLPPGCYRTYARRTHLERAGPLALIHPLLAKLDIEALIDRHVPPDPQQEYAHGQVLNVLLSARLCQPTALMNVAGWAEKTGADILANIPADKLNDDRLGRALDAFFDHRHSILASVTATVLAQTGAELKDLHFDTTDLVLSVAYESSQARPEWPAAQPFTGDAALPPRTSAMATPPTPRCSRPVNWPSWMPTAPCRCWPIASTATAMDTRPFSHVRAHQHHLPLADDLLLFSDRGTCSVEHNSCLHRHGYAAVSPPVARLPSHLRRPRRAPAGKTPAFCPSSNGGGGSTTPPCRGNITSWRCCATPSAIPARTKRSPPD